MKRLEAALALWVVACACTPADDPPSPGGSGGQAWWKPYSAPCTEREQTFEFTEKPAVKLVGEDRYEITFAVKGYCDATVGIVDGAGKVLRHLASGVLGPNAPDPFQKDSLKQAIYWNGKDDLDVYHKAPQTLSARVGLGLNPRFEKRLGGASPYNMPGFVWGVAAAPDGVYVISGCGKSTRLYIRKFDHDCRYVMTVSPPPANLPESKVEGMGCIEYEPGKKALHSKDVYQTVVERGCYLDFNSRMATDCQPVVIKDKLYFCDGGFTTDPVETCLYWVHTDGSTDMAGISGRAITWPIKTPFPRLAASPDGQWLYISVGKEERRSPAELVVRAKVDDTGKAAPFLGNFSVDSKGNVRVAPGSDNKSFQMPIGIDCDAQGRICVADLPNNRVQVFMPDGKHLKTLAIERPYLVQVHRKTGGVYVLHSARIKGATIQRLTKLVSLDDPREDYHVDNFAAATFALDSWSAKPRLWVGGGIGGERDQGDLRGIEQRRVGFEVYEEGGKGCRKILDFDEAAANEDGGRYLGRWGGSIYGKVVCDVARNRLYYTPEKGMNVPAVIDLESGKCLGFAQFRGTDDIAIDKKGYVHCHFNPGFFLAGVGRLDPSSVIETEMRDSDRDPTLPPKTKFFAYGEVPYDYGDMPGGIWTPFVHAVAGAFRGRKDQWVGIIRTKCQPGAKYFQDGIGVNMRGDIAVQSNIYYVPKMDDVGAEEAASGVRIAALIGGDNHARNKYVNFLRDVQDLQKQGEDVYFIRRRAGVPVSGGTVWTFDSTGELRDECAAIPGDLVNGVQIDEAGDLYFINARLRVMDSKGTAFLSGKGGRFGDPAGKAYNPLTGTLMKTRSKDAKVLLAKGAVPLDPLPDRPPDFIATNYAGKDFPKNEWAWADGAKWLYAGASPIIYQGCSCPTMRHYTDWYKRSFVPEAYRHSIGALDTNGNLIMHIGQYGNLDSGDGPKSKIPVGGDGIAMTFVRFVAATDDRLVFDDHGERIVCLKLDYHAEETVGIR